jgi:aldehyde dehydrogenase (NAD+)
MIEGKNLIAGELRASSNGASFEDRDPATGALIGHWPESTERDVEDAVAAARRAFDSWRRTPVARRGEILLRSMRVLEAHRDEFAAALTTEMGKVLAEARGDVQEAIDTALYYAGEGRRLFGHTTTSELPRKFAMSVRQPVGVCALVSPWNFPIAIPSWKTYPALLCGNTVVLKPSPLTPHCAELFARVLTEAGVPPGVFNVVHGGGLGAAGEWLTAHDDVALVSFTGSSAVGRAIAERCGRALKRCSLELGGKNAMIVLDDADLDLAVDGALWGAFGTAGQRCTATSRLIVHQRVYDAFAEKLVTRTRALRLGSGLDASTDVGPLVSASQLTRVTEYVRIGVAEGARLLCGGARSEQGVLARGHFFEPTIFEASRTMRIAREEIFGPVTALLRVRDFDDALATMNATDYGLSGAVYTRDVERVMRAIEDMHVGIAYVNAPTIGAEVHLPFGGVKQTGNGHREAGQAALDVFSEWKAVYIDYSGRLQKAQIDTKRENP